MRHIDVAISVPGLSENWLGGVNYFRNLVSVFDSAAARAGSLRLHVLTNQAGYFDDLKLSPRVVLHKLPMLERKSAAWFVRKAAMAALDRDVLLVGKLRQLGVKAVVFSHVPGLQAAGIRCLPWIPDFQSQHHPDWFDPGVVETERKRAMSWLHDGDGLIVSSYAARDDAVRLFGAVPERIHVMRFAPQLDAHTLAAPALRDAVFARHGIDRPFVFLPNQYWKHKNHGLVIDALAALREGRRVAPLIISTGKQCDLRDTGYYPEFEARLRAAGVAEQYRVLGVIDRQDMLVLLAHSMAVLNPSRFEGWSTSVEEAKALGKPVLASDIPVHREQLQHDPQAEHFGVDDAGALAALLHRWGVAANGQSATAFAPQPQPRHHEHFVGQYLELLTMAAAPEGVAA